MLTVRDNGSVHGYSVTFSNFTRNQRFQQHPTYRNLDSKFAKAVPSGSAGDIDWLFELSTPWNMNLGKWYSIVASLLLG